ncbi:MAG TPA: hypothetical protein VFB93_23780 [Burkholderiales bacterium]|nr:hypothetical protein [Burkholderiales bacterium]
MLLFVPQGFVALVYEDGVLRAVVEAGVGFVARARGALQVQFVDLQQLQPDQEAEVHATLH